MMVSFPDHESGLSHDDIHTVTDGRVETDGSLWPFMNLEAIKYDTE